MYQCWSKFWGNQWAFPVSEIFWKRDFLHAQLNLSWRMKETHQWSIVSLDYGSIWSIRVFYCAWRGSLSVVQQNNWNNWGKTRYDCCFCGGLKTYSQWQWQSLAFWCNQVHYMYVWTCILHGDYCLGWDMLWWVLVWCDLVFLWSGSFFFNSQKKRFSNT